METDTIQAGNSRPSEDIQPADINYEVAFGTLKRQLLVFLAPAALIVGVFLEASSSILSIVGFFIIIFGLWMPFHGVLGYAEVWRFEDRVITRIRRNWVWKGEKRWTYDAVKNVRFKPRDNHILPEMLIKGKGWLALPEQTDQLTADRLKTLIGDFKRAATANPQDQTEIA